MGKMQLSCSILTETTCHTWSLDLIALKDCLVLAFNPDLNFCVKLKHYIYQGLAVPTETEQEMTTVSHTGSEFPSILGSLALVNLSFLSHDVLFPCVFYLPLSLCVSHTSWGMMCFEEVLCSAFLLLSSIFTLIPTLHMWCLWSVAKLQGFLLPCN